MAQYEIGYRTPKASVVKSIANALNVREETFLMPNDTVVDFIRTLIWYDWEHGSPFQDLSESPECFSFRLRLSCSHPAVKALLSDWRIHRRLSMGKLKPPSILSGCFNGLHSPCKHLLIDFSSSLCYHSYSFVMARSLTAIYLFFAFLRFK